MTVKTESGGRIWGLGVGPGDPELITLKAARLLAGADIVAYPAPQEGESLARSIAAPHLPDGVEEYPIRISMDPKDFPQHDVYDIAADWLGDRAEAGASIAILCEGDPFFYGSFMYLFDRLSGRMPVEIVPGITSLTACASRLAMPLAARNDVLTVIPATLAQDTIVARLKASDSAAIIKVGRHLEKVRSALGDAGLLDNVRYIERATMEQEYRAAPGDLPDDKAPYFSMILVHRRGGAAQ